MDRYYLNRNFDGTYTLVVYVRRFDSEFAKEFFDSDKVYEIIAKIAATGRQIAIKTVRFILVGGIVISIPFGNLLISGKAKNEQAYAMSYVYFGSVATQIENVKKAESALDVVSPSYFNLTDSGSLDLSSISTTFIDTMHADGLKVVPFLSNHWDNAKGIAALNNIEGLSHEIADAVNTYNLDGVNIDVENVNELYRNSYTQLVMRIRELISSDKEVSVAVAANPDGWKIGWQGSYDYEQLGKYADHIFIMTYDEHYEGGDAGSVAGIDFVRESIEYALKYVPAEKIVMGIPFFGRLWGGNCNGTGISLSRVDELLDLYDATTYFDEESKSPVATFTVGKNSPKFTLNGKILSEGTYTLWYENTESLRTKFKLFEEYGLKGVGNWSAGQETDDVWDYYELWLSGIYFKDINENFAKQDIIKLYKEGIMIGETEDEFYPDRSLTRAEATIIMARVMGISESQQVVYKDTVGHFACGYISAVTKAGLMKGYEDGTFRPDNLMSRQEMAVMLSRIAEPDYHSISMSYSDVPGNLWSFDEISALTAMGIMRGYEDGTFRPLNSVTRGEMAALINRLEEKG
ncbi:MAG: S-layer homology domain-containing protein [Bacillota bacterium]|nr:S-layer homology domain-containing protein [Bacillota bacterium]